MHTLRIFTIQDNNWTWFKRSKATNERQDDGAGILHQVAQFPIDQVYFIYIQGGHAPLHPRKTRRDKVLTAKHNIFHNISMNFGDVTATANRGMQK